MSIIEAITRGFAFGGVVIVAVIVIFFGMSAANEAALNPILHKSDVLESCLK